MNRTDGRRWAYTGAILGVCVSIAANIAHSFVPPEDHPAGAEWKPAVGYVISSIAWPVFAYIGIEVLARVDWSAIRYSRLLRWAGVLPVAAVAAVASYTHMAGLLTHYGDDDLIVKVGPLAVDGTMLICTVVLIATGRTAPAQMTESSVHEPRPLPMLARPVDLRATVASRPSGWVAPSAWPVLAIAPRLASRPEVASPASEPASQPVELATVGQVAAAPTGQANGRSAGHLATLAKPLATPAPVATGQDDTAGQVDDAEAELASYGLTRRTYGGKADRQADVAALLAKAPTIGAPTVARLLAIPAKTAGNDLRELRTRKEN